MTNANLSAFAAETQFSTEIQYGTAGNALNRQEYIGFAPAGTTLAESAWQIKKLTYDSSGRLLRFRFADGSNEFNQAFVNPELLTYS